MLTSTRSHFMQPIRLVKGAAYLVFAAALAMTAATAQLASAQVASGTTGIDASGSAKSEMAACRSGKNHQARATCMNEARNASAAKRAGKLGNDGDLAANALMRCDVFKSDADRSACKARVMNDTNAQGSITGGGVLREAETAVPAPQ